MYRNKCINLYYIIIIIYLLFVNEITEINHDNSPIELISITQQQRFTFSIEKRNINILNR
jgi:hypothetical protein